MGAVVLFLGQTPYWPLEGSRAALGGFMISKALEIMTLRFHLQICSRNLKTNVQRELNILTPKFGQLSLKSRREKELELARNIINRVRRTSPVLERRVDKMMLKEGYQRLDKRKSKSK